MLVVDWRTRRERRRIGDLGSGGLRFDNILDIEYVGEN